jgi:hypothetical protein
MPQEVIRLLDVDRDNVFLLYEYELRNGDRYRTRSTSPSTADRSPRSRSSSAAGSRRSVVSVRPPGRSGSTG